MNIQQWMRKTATKMIASKVAAMCETELEETWFCREWQCDCDTSLMTDEQLEEVFVEDGCPHSFSHHEHPTPEEAIKCDFGKEVLVRYVWRIDTALGTLMCLQHMSKIMLQDNKAFS